MSSAPRQVFYNPFTGFSGADSFDYRATARGAASNSARFDLSVAGPARRRPGRRGGGGGGGGGSTPQLIPSTVTQQLAGVPEVHEGDATCR